MTAEDLQGQVARSAAVERELREKIAQLEHQVEEAKSAAARTCYQGGTAAGEVLAKMEAETVGLRKAITNLTERVGAADAETQRQLEANTSLWRSLAVFYGIGVACDRCGAPPTKPCITGQGRITVHETRVTKAAAEIPADDLLSPPDFAASDNAALRQPAVGPAQDGAGADLPLSGIPPIDHDFKPNPWPKRDECDKRVSDNPDGRPSRQCGRPRREHQNPEGGK